MFRLVKLTKNADPNKYSSCGIGFDSRSECSLTDGTIDKNVIIFGVIMSSSVHVNNKNKSIFILDKGPT